MPSDFVIIATLGTSDVQVVWDWQGKPTRFRLARGHERAFHEACLEIAFPWQVRALAESVAPQLVRNAEKLLHFDPQKRELSTDMTEEAPDYFEIDCAGGVTLCCPLLAELRESVWRLQRTGRLGKALHVLLLNTRREGGTFRNQEPVAAAEIGRGVLAEGFGLTPEEVTECVFLGGDERLHACDRFGQEHLLTAAARRIDTAIRELADRHPGSMALISDVAGLPDVKAVLAASCRYRFGRRLRFVGPPERREAEEAHVGLLVPPAESLLTRMQVAALVQGGAFDAAARAAMANGESFDKVEPWRRWLRAVAGVFDGDLSLVQSIEVTRNSRMREAVSQVISQGPALLSAIRVEAALLRGNWIWALRETFTFLEIARDEILDISLRRPGTSCWEESQKRLLLANMKDGCAERLLAMLAEDCELSMAEQEFRAWCVEFEVSEQEAYATGKAWCPVSGKVAIFLAFLRQVCPFSEIAALAARKHKMGLFANGPVYQSSMTLLSDCARPALETFRNAVEPVRAIRNQSTHAPLSSKAIQRAKETLQEGGVWSARGRRFLENPPVRNLAEALGWGAEAAARAYDGLVSAVREDMDKHSFQESLEAC